MRNLLGKRFIKENRVMKKRILMILLAAVMVLGAASPVAAASPDMEDWEFASFANHSAYAYYSINTVNLQVSSFTIVNNSEQPVMVTIRYDGFTDADIIWSFTALPGETITEPINNFKFHRLPLTDPDNPDAVRYPNKTYIFARYG